MSLYQPSFMVPHNEAIDATNIDDMKFKWQLNGNNLLCAYNIQIFDVDSNQRVYQLISTEYQDVIQENINRLSGYIDNQNQKIEKLDSSQEEYGNSTLKSQFRIDLESDRTSLNKKYESMKKILDKKKEYDNTQDPDEKEKKKPSASDIDKYFQYWGEIVEGVKNRVGKVVSDATGKPVTPTEGSAEAIKMQIEEWVNVDPQRTDGIEYKGDVQLIDDTAFETVKSTLSEYSSYYDNVIAARRAQGASDMSFITDTTLEKALKTIYLMYSKHTNESYYAKDLYEAVNKMFSELQFDSRVKECQTYLDKWTDELEQQVYALAHFNGGSVTSETSLYKIASESDANLIFTIPKDGSVAIITTETNPPSGWTYVAYKDLKGYIKTANLEYYNIKDGKYYLDKPIPPTNYEGKANVVEHQLPIDILQNGKAYKWSVTLYWSTSGDYTKDNMIDGQLTSVECYFDTRKRPNVYLKNVKQVFTIPYNYVDVVQNAAFEYTKINKEKDIVQLNIGDKVLFLHLDENDETQAVIKTQTKDNVEVEGTVPLRCLSGTGNYDVDKEGNKQQYKLHSKYATFVGGYEQEQHVSISYFRWVLSKLQYDSEEVVEVVKDTGMIPSIDMKLYYDGFLNGEKYSIKLYVQTLDNVEAESIEYKFEVSYIDISIENMVNAENSPIEHGIIVEWSNLRLIQGEIFGTSSYKEDSPIDGHTTLTLDKGSTLTFDKDKGQPLSIDWDANHIISIRIDEDRPEDQVYYAATGLDDDGDVISKTLELVNREDTDTTGKADLVYVIKTKRGQEEFKQEIIASPLYWYIVIMTNKELIVYTKYADGLFPMRELVPSYNNFTQNPSPVPLPLRYYEEPSDRVLYDYQTIIKKGGEYRDD